MTTILESAIQAPVGIEQTIRNTVAAKDSQGFHRLRRELAHRLRDFKHKIQNGENLAKGERDELSLVLLQSSAFMSVIADYHELHHNAQIATGSWPITLAKIFDNYQLSKEDERAIAAALEKLIESKRAQRAATQELIETLTTVLPQGG